nr:MAG TPA: putative cytoplasmic protein [Caudoviricetes sp.]
MDEYIKREEALQQCSRFSDYTAWSISDGIGSIQAADVAPVVHGKDLASPSLFHCSVCGCEDDDTYTCDVSEYRYCPNCGAKIDEKAKPEPSVVTIYKCSGCGTRSMEFSKGDHFCFFCGAKMDEEEDTQ